MEETLDLWGTDAISMEHADVRHMTKVHLAGDTGVLVKRDDTFDMAGQYGGKVRSCAALCADAAKAGSPGIVTAGSRHSPQVQIVAHLANHYNLRARCHVPAGDETPQLLSAEMAGAELVRHRPGYNTVIVARARNDAQARRWYEIPFGMEHQVAVDQTASQVDANQLAQAKRLVVPVGSGMTLAGILHGLRRANLDVPVLGIQVGADPTKRLARWAPPDWRERVRIDVSPLPYSKSAPVTVLADIDLDPIYEAKCLPFLQQGDLFWLVGHRNPEVGGAA